MPQISSRTFNLEAGEEIFLNRPSRTLLNPSPELHHIERVPHRSFLPFRSNNDKSDQKPKSPQSKPLKGRGSRLLSKASEASLGSVAQSETLSSRVRGWDRGWGIKGRDSGLGFSTIGEKEPSIRSSIKSSPRSTTSKTASSFRRLARSLSTLSFSTSSETANERPASSMSNASERPESSMSTRASPRPVPTRVARLMQRGAAQVRRRSKTLDEITTAPPSPPPNLPPSPWVSVTGRDDVIPMPGIESWRPPNMADTAQPFAFRQFLGGFETKKTYEPLFLENAVRRQAGEPLIRKVKSTHWHPEQPVVRGAPIPGSFPGATPPKQSLKALRQEAMSPTGLGFDMRASRLKTGEMVGMHYAGKSGELLTCMSRQALSRGSSRGDQCVEQEMLRAPTQQSIPLVADPRYRPVSRAESLYYGEDPRSLSRTQSAVSLRSAYTAEAQLTEVTARRLPPSQLGNHTSHANGFRPPGNMAYVHMNLVSDDDLPAPASPRITSHRPHPVASGRTYSLCTPMEYFEHPAYRYETRPEPANPLLQHINARRFPGPSPPSLYGQQQQRTMSMTSRVPFSSHPGPYHRGAAAWNALDFDPPSRTNMSFMSREFGVQYSY